MYTLPTFIEHCYNLHELIFNLPKDPMVQIAYYHILQRGYLKLREVECLAPGQTEWTGQSQDVGPGRLFLSTHSLPPHYFVLPTSWCPTASGSFLIPSLLQPSLSISQRLENSLAIKDMYLRGDGLGFKSRQHHSLVVCLGANLTTSLSLTLINP